MSALPPKADIGGDGCDVRFVPKADIGSLFDHLVGGHRQSLRHFQAERLRCPDVEDELEFSRLQEWQLRRFGTAQDPTGIQTTLMILVGYTRSVADQPATMGSAARLL
jgi:hypothetical protein